MKIITKEMETKIATYLKFSEEIRKFLEEDCGLEGINLSEMSLCEEPKGELQENGSYCYQKQIYEDWFIGSVYLPVEGGGKWLEVPYEI